MGGLSLLQTLSVFLPKKSLLQNYYKTTTDCIAGAVPYYRLVPFFFLKKALNKGRNPLKQSLKHPLKKVKNPLKKEALNKG